MFCQDVHETSAGLTLRQFLEFKLHVHSNMALFWDMDNDRFIQEFTQMDTDGNRHISKKEFIQVFSRNS